MKKIGDFVMNHLKYKLLEGRFVIVRNLEIPT